MDQAETTWFFYNLASRTQLGPLTAVDARISIAEMSTPELAVWLVWKTGWTEWKTARTVDELFPMIAASATQPPIPRPVLAASPEKKQEAAPASPQAEPATGRFRVVVRRDQYTFRTFSNEVTPDGIVLENEMPEKFRSGDCQVFITGPNQKECVRFSLDTNSKIDKKQFAFVNPDQNFVATLRTWVDKLGGGSRSA